MMIDRCQEVLFQQCAILTQESAQPACSHSNQTLTAAHFMDNFPSSLAEGVQILGSVTTTGYQELQSSSSYSTEGTLPLRSVKSYSTVMLHLCSVK